MKKIIITILFLLIILTTIAYTKPITIETAKQVAINWYLERNEMEIDENVQIIETFYNKENSLDIYYIFNFNTGGYIIISADDAAVPILGYNFEQNYGLENHPPQFTAMMDNFTDQILFIKDNGLTASNEIKQEWQRLNTSSDNFEKDRKINRLGPLLETKWDQGEYFNEMCPYDAASTTGNNHVWAGCVATAMAQIMNYWGYPQKGIGSHSYNHPYYGNQSANFGTTTYNWANMPDSVSSTNTDVQTLLYHCGVSVDMNYGPTSSGASTSDAVYAYENYFKYDPSAYYDQKSSYTNNEWETMIRDDLDEGRPLHYRGYGAQGGHSFNLDGYESSDISHFHFNWGGSGSYNGYYYLSDLNPGTHNYTSNQAAIFNIEPRIVEVSGNITQDTTWNYEDIYVITSNLYIDDGVTLTIEPGTIVKFNIGNVRMEIQGTLIAEGTENDSIYFTSYRDDSVGGDTNGDADATAPSRGDWQMVYFNGADAGTSVDYCIFKYAGRNNYWGNNNYRAHCIYLNDSQINISNSIIEENDASYTGSYTHSSTIWVESNAPTTLNNVIVRNNNYYGIYSNATLTMTDCEVYNNGSDGLYSSGDGILTNNNIHDNEGFGYYLHPNMVHQVWENGNVNTNNGHLDAIGIIGGTTYTNNSVWNANDQYFISGTLTISNESTLTIEPGTIVKFNIGNVRMEIQGTLIAEGTENDSIYFTSYRDDSVGGDTNGDADATTPSRGDWQMVYFNGADAGTSVDYCIFKYAGRNYYWDDHNYKAHCIYLNDSQINISNSIIEENDASYTGSYAHSSTIWVESNAPTTLNNVIVRNNNYYGIYSNATLTMTDCEVYNNGSDGLYSSGDGILTNNNIHDNEGFGYYLHPNMVHQVWENGNVNTNNGHLDAIGITGGTYSQTTQWIDENQYVVFGNVTFSDGSTLVIEPGTIVKFNIGNVRMEIQGTLIAEGTENDSIYFTSYRDDSVGGDTNGDADATTPSRGDWQMVYFNGADAGTSVDYCIFKYAGRNYYWDDHNYKAHCIYLNDSQINISNSIIEENDASYTGSYAHSSTIWVESNAPTTLNNVIVRNNNYYGIYSNATLTMTDCEVYNNGNRGIYCTGSNSSFTGVESYNNGSDGLYSSGDGTISNTTVHDNVGFGYRIHSNMVHQVWENGNINTNNGHLDAIGITGGTYSQSTEWIDENQYVIFDNVTFSDGSSLVIEPGTIIKFNVGDVRIEIEGALIAEGTENDSIYFTSYRDDSIGGDTNGDGDDTTPSRGDWAMLYFSGADAGTNLDYCIFKYAGRNISWSYHHYKAHCIYLNDSQINISNSIIEENDASYTGSYDHSGTIWIESNAPTTLTNVIIRNNNRYGIYSSATLTMTDCEVYNNGNRGINSNGNNSIFSNIIIYDNDGDGFHGTGNNVTLTNTTIYGNTGEGIDYDKDFWTFNNNTIYDNGGYGIYVNANLVHDICNCSGVSERITFRGGTIYDDAVWDSDLLYVCNGNTTLDDNVTLILEPGTIIKFNSNYQIEIKGTLVAQGTAAEKIIFTSIHNDSYGGDSNHNGFSTLPAPGDWSRLYFNGADAGTVLGWVIISYAGYNNDDALTLYNTNLDIENMIIIKNKDRGIYCGNNSFIDITYSDIYENGYGLENQNFSSPAQAEENWWGDPSGPYNATTNPSGLGNEVSDHVDFDNWRNRSIDNPWSIFPSPTSNGQYYDMTAINLNDDDYIDLVGATNTGLDFFQRTGFETWEEIPSPITTGSYMTVLSKDLNSDGFTDLVAGGSNGVTTLLRTAKGWDLEHVLTGYIVFDIVVDYVDDDGYYDLVIACGNNSGLKVFYGTASGWTEGNKPDSTTTFHSVKVADFNQDSYVDIVATNMENAGLQIWHNDTTGGWIQQDPLDLGYAFYGLDTKDVDFNGYPDIVTSGNTPEGGIAFYLNQGDGTYVQSYSPTSFGIYNDIKLTDMNGDSYYDMAASNQGSGIQTWLGSPNLYWNYWYHPIETSQFKRIEVVDMTLDNTPDVVAASYGDGIKIWSNRTPYGNINPVFSTSEDELDFDKVLVDYSRTLPLTIENISSDTLLNVVIYTTNPIFQVSENTKNLRDVGPFTLLPGEEKDVFVTFSPTTENFENEGLILHSIPEVLLVPLIGEGVEEAVPEWAVDISVENATGGVNNNQTLTFGTGIGATDTLDFIYNEVNLPPLPPSNIFDARFQITGYEGFLRDIRDYEGIEHEYIIQWQAGDGGYPLTISWDQYQLPDGVLTIHDIVGGIFIDTTYMDTTSELTIPETMAGVPYLQIEFKSYNDFTYDLTQSWNLISLPIETMYHDIDSLFDTAISAFWYNPFTPGYQQETIMNSGKGYWLEMPSSQDKTLIGNKITDMTVSLLDGWNLVGTIYNEIDVNDLDVDPEGSLISVFGFNGSYFSSTTLQPGCGYWLEVSQDCDITMDNSAKKNGENNSHISYYTQSKNKESTEGWMIPIEIEISQNNYYQGKNSNKETYTVNEEKMIHFGVHPEATEGIDRILGEINLPPLPPSEVFDTRFIIEETNSSVIDIRKSDGEYHNYIISLQTTSEDYPITLQWNNDMLPESGDFILSDNMGGVFIPPLSMVELNSIILPDTLNFVSEILIQAQFPYLVNDDPSLPAPTHHYLGNNYPNPTNTLTTITYNLKKETDVIIEIFNIKGQKIHTLINNHKDAGYHHVVWNCLDCNKAMVPTGVYFYRMKTDDYDEVRKMLIIR